MAQELGDVSGATMALSAVALTVLICLRRFLPILPGALIVVVAAIGVSWAFDLGDHGIALVGPVEGGLPRPTFPTPPLGDVVELLPAAAGLFLVAFADEILTARAFAGKRREHVRASQELLTMGVANAAAGLTQAFSIGASGARTAVNDAMGVRTQFAGLFAAGAVVAILLFLTGPIKYLPQAILASVIVVAGIGIVDRAAWRALAAIDRVEVAIAGVTTDLRRPLRRAPGARGRRRALDHRHGATERPAVRRGARLGPQPSRATGTSRSTRRRS